MYKRYYDGYNTYSRNSAPYSGEVVIPKDSEEESVQTAEIAEEPATAPEDKNEIQFTVQDGNAAVASLPRGGSNPLNGLSRIFDDISIDDIILFGVILLVLKDSADDPLLIMILAVIFISGLIDRD